MRPAGWIEHGFRPLVAGLMLSTIVWALAELLHTLSPAWGAAWLAGYSGLAAVAAYYSYRYVDAQRWDTTHQIRFRLAEVVLLYFGAQVLLTIVDPGYDLLQQLRRFDFISVGTFVVVLLSWMLGGLIASDLARIGEPPEQVPGYRTPLESLAGRFFVGGAVLLVLTGLNRVALADLLNTDRPPVPGLVINVLIYFVLGIALLGQVRYSALLERWGAQQLRVAPSLGMTWVRYSLIFAALVALLALLLPTHYTVGLLDTLRTLVGILGMLGMLLIWLILALLSLPFALLGLGQTPAPPQPPALPFTPPPAEPAGPGMDPVVAELLKSALFWLVIGAVAVYALRGYLQQHPALLAAVRRLAPLRALIAGLGALWGWLRGRRAALATSARQAVTRLRAARATVPRLPTLGRAPALTPREQVRQYYLRVLQRAEAHGFPRRPPQTPSEYDAALAPALPAAHPDMARLTRAFEEARYSAHPVGPAEADAALAAGKQVEAALDAPPAPAEPPRDGKA